jgi:hypothetical protein
MHCMTAVVMSSAIHESSAHASIRLRIQWVHLGTQTVF